MRTFKVDNKDATEYLTKTTISWASACKEVAGGGICKSKHVGYYYDEKHVYLYGDDGGWEESDYNNFAYLLRSNSGVGLGEHGKGLRSALYKYNKESDRKESFIINRYKGKFGKTIRVATHDNKPLEYEFEICSEEDVNIYNKYVGDLDGTLFKLPLPNTGKNFKGDTNAFSHKDNIKTLNHMFIPRFKENDFEFKHEDTELNVSQEKGMINSCFFSNYVDVTMKRDTDRLKYIEFSDTPTFFNGDPTAYTKCKTLQDKKFNHEIHSIKNVDREVVENKKKLVGKEILTKCRIYYSELGYNKTDEERKQNDSFLKKYFCFANHKTASCGFFLSVKNTILNGEPFGYGRRGAGFHCRPICIIELDDKYKDQISTDADKSRVTVEHCKPETNSIIKFFCDRMVVSKDDDSDKKQRIEFSISIKRKTLTSQEHKCKITKQLLHRDTQLYDFDHIDDDNQNISDNCQAIVTHVHRIKTNNKDKYKAIEKEPLALILDTIINNMNTPYFKASLSQFKDRGCKTKLKHMKEIIEKVYGRIESKGHMNNDQERIDEIFNIH